MENYKNLQFSWKIVVFLSYLSTSTLTRNSLLKTSETPIESDNLLTFDLHYGDV